MSNTTKKKITNSTSSKSLQSYIMKFVNQQNLDDKFASAALERFRKICLDHILVLSTK